MALRLCIVKTGYFGVYTFAKHVANSANLSLKHIVETTEDSDIVSIHAHAGMANTGLFKKS